MRPLHIAFLSSEYVSESYRGGGLSNYLFRMSQALKDLGHIVEIFVSSSATPNVIIHAGIRVERIPTIENMPLRALTKMIRTLNLSALRSPLFGLNLSASLSRALDSRHLEYPFDIVQVPDNYGIGLFVKKYKGRLLFARISSNKVLWDKEINNSNFGTILRRRIEKLSIMRADVVYAPSHFVADYFEQNSGIKVNVVRPPLESVKSMNRNLSITLPNKFFLHFGRICAPKGSDELADALVRAWTVQPEIKMVWAGPIIGGKNFNDYKSLWGDFASNVTWLGSLPQDELFEVIKRAKASILPSIIDNLPNTVIESVSLGTPVIGFKGGSVDELVIPGINGELAPINDTEMLASIMVDVWNEKITWERSAFLSPSIFSEMEPSIAAQKFLALARHANSR